MTEAGTAAPQERQSARFLWLYALAAAGGAVAYVPFLTILLPERVAGFAGEDAVAVLAYAAFAGAIAASLANIGFGWISDRTRARRPWIAVGLALSAILLVAMRNVDSLAMLIPLLVGWQIALNMMLAPLAAWAGDRVPDEQKGMLGGLLAFAPALGALSGAIVTSPGLADPDTRLLLVAGLVAVMVTPVLLLGDPRPMPHLMADPQSASEGLQRDRRDPVLRMWFARLLIQIAEAALFAFLLVWFRSIDAAVTDNYTAKIFSFVLGASVPVALFAGRWSDRTGNPVLPLVLGAGFGAAGLVVMAIARDMSSGIAGYILFGLATSIFLALHSSQTLRVLPKPSSRGRDLGFFNLTNTVPSLIMPWLTLALVPVFGFGALFWLLAALSAAACALLLSIRRI